MPKRRLILGVLALGLLATLIIVLTRSSEPSYQGRSLTHWLEQYRNNTLSTSDEDSVRNARQEAASAIQAIGTNAIPCLLRWTPARKAPSQWKLRTAYLIEKIAGDAAAVFFIKTTEPELYRAMMAYWGLVVLGPQAQAAVPELSRLMNDANILNGEQVAVALAGVGEQAIPPLIAAMTNPAAPHRVAAIRAVFRTGTPAKQTVPVLVALLEDRDGEIRRVASNALRRIDRHALTNALLRIAPEVLTNAPSK